MLDFLIINQKTLKNTIEIYPKFRLYPKSQDLMIRGGDFYAVWMEDEGLWSTNEDDVARLIDKELYAYAEEHKNEFKYPVHILHMWDSESGMIDSWHKYCQRQLRDSYNMLDETLIFSNSPTNKKDYATKRLPYPLAPGDTPSYDRLMSVLYSDEERHKIEWAIGSIISGDSKTIQKFMVLYGAAGTGKSTVLNIIQQLFEGYYSVFDAKALGSSSNSFALEAFRNNPLVAIQHDGDLSKIEDNTRLNSLVSHEEMTVNEKFKSTYSSRFKCFLFMGTNKPVKISDGKSGIIRRLIDVSPTGDKLGAREYKSLTKQISFELGAIASHCLDVYNEDPGFYDNYIPITMIGASNDFYNYVIDSYNVFIREDGTTLKSAWEMYKLYCEDARVPYPLSQRLFKEELKNYFKEYYERYTYDGARIRNYYKTFKTSMFDIEENPSGDIPKNNIVLEGIPSILDEMLRDCFAQYATKKETPLSKWDTVKTTLKDIDTSKVHYVKPPSNHIVIDFDIKVNGKKSLERNIEEASKWPPTYTEVSKGGNGLHLHYIYTGDVSKLSNLYSKDIEIKTFPGNSSLRRKLSKCNNLPVAILASGLPLKEENRVVDFDGIKNEKAVRTMLIRNMKREYHANTKPSVDYICKILEDAYNSGIHYDVSDLRNDILAFAASSTNNAAYCMKAVNNAPFKSEDCSDNVFNDDAPIVFYDVEVFPNLFVICYKERGADNVVKLINPTSKDIDSLIRYRLIGFNNKRYDDHILYARLMGYTNEQLFNLSQRLVSNDRNATFGEAYHLAYTDIYDFSSDKKSLKKWEIELGIHHQELGLPWDKEVDESLWTKVAEYCVNDVVATEAVFEHLQGDFTARKILAELAGMTVGDSTNALTTRIIFGKERNPYLVYTDLNSGKQFYDGHPDNFGNTPDVINSFPGYKYEDGKNMFRGVNVGRGGYVYAEPGIYGNVALLDVASMHPHSIIAMNCFGKYTKNFQDIMDARIAIKHGDFETARTMLDGKLAPYLNDESQAKALAQALKIAINSVYGLTSSNMNTPFKDIRNKNNIVALRGALFMKTLQDEVQKRGFTVAHIKTDSIKIPDATPEIIQFVMDFAKPYGYTFEHEATYERMCLVNDAVYVAKYDSGEWTATGAQFKVPYVFKTLFSKEEIKLDDLCETKSVKTSLLLRDGDKLEYIGKVGRFCPIMLGYGGKELVREGTDKNGNIKYSSATGAKGYEWLESEVVFEDYSLINSIDYSYYDKLVYEAIDTIGEFGDYELFMSNDPIPNGYAKNIKELPWE